MPAASGVGDEGVDFQEEPMGTDPSDPLVSKQTRAAERREATRSAGAGPEPTAAEEEAAAEAHGPAGAGAAEHAEEQYETGALAKGEGRTP